MLTFILVLDIMILRRLQMKYCTHCGNQIDDEDAVVCTHCGCAVEKEAKSTSNSTSEVLQTIAKVFMIIGCVASASFFLIPLCWTIPMTLHYFNATKEKQPLSVGFKVCSLLFVSLVAGIMMLCDNSNNN